VAGERGPDQRTPQLASLVQEIVDRPDWAAGNAMAFLIAGSGRRIGDSTDKPWGQAPALSVQWTDASDTDRDLLPDAFERLVAPPSQVDPVADPDGDGVLTCQEYVAGTDPGDANSVPRIRLKREDPLVVAFDAEAPATPPYPAGTRRYYTLEHRQALSSDESGGYVQYWLEDLSLADGATSDDGPTAWTSETDSGSFYVTNGMFRAQNTRNNGARWVSESLELWGQPARLSVDVRSEGRVDRNEYIKFLYSVDDGPEILIDERYDNFNGNDWETLSVAGVRGMSVRLIVRIYNDRNDAFHYFDNIRVETRQDAGWPAVPAVSNVLVDTPRTIHYTNDTPLRADFYRLRVRLGQGH
jgi:hypothetical protein